ncbi:MAG: PD-(D/E)XK nuclease family transposase [Nitrospirae bacterium]|uniref:PD-(D/E)XK nuclease family transposase n=1 Tax=Candidatus Magnetobacterium casense TaxID=1455061 RepID=UPI0005907652|nr:PD-(D/E)XK nuclease family transposase [Candidatus Magnetobacterium casensis]MBF0336548.1 PD-(D/E)XK nuclease family transposase [Nitrospirota bacterium]
MQFVDVRNDIAFKKIFGNENKKEILISFLNSVLDLSTYRQELKDLEFNFIELPKFTRTEDELESITDKWIHFIKNAVSLHMVPKCADSVELQEAYEIATLTAS